MVRLAAALLALALGACATTSTVHQALVPAAGGTYAYAFENNGGDDDLAGVARLARTIRDRLRDAGLLAADDTPGGRVEVELTHYYVRSDATRVLAGILAGRDRIASRVTVLGADGAPVGGFEVETTNLSAFGSKDGLMAAHADEIVARLRPGADPHSEGE